MKKPGEKKSGEKNPRRKKPGIGEPMVSYGPFVMNDNEELQQAVSDFQDGKMGELVETFEE